ncbi:MAG: hypothetical protein R6U50_05550 [Desulfobacterales bacterium]
MSKVHRRVMKNIIPPVRPVFIDTPAGFQLNIDEISEKAVRYFKKHFNMPLAIASYTSSAIPPEKENKALTEILRANYIFAGPGSPTYTVRQWRNTRILNTLQSQLAGGAHIVLASAASIAIGAFALPVYEIYKVGEPLHWMNGLNFLAPWGLEPVIIPHWNNKEGGTHDTRFCYMGAPRLQVLEKQLPASTVIVGIDEYTALTLDFAQNCCTVGGSGTVTLKKEDGERQFHSKDRFDLTCLEPDHRRSNDDAGTAGFSPRIPQPEPFIGAGEPPEGIEKKGELPDTVIELLFDIRSELRREKRWDLADAVRDSLSSFGIAVEDGPDRSTWRRIG